MTKSEYQELIEFLGVRFDQMQAQHDRRFDRIDAIFDRIDAIFDRMEDGAKHPNSLGRTEPRKPLPPIPPRPIARLR